MNLDDVFKNEDLRRWVKEKWTDQHGRPCGSSKTKGVKKCRPSKKISKDTPKTWSSFDKDEKKALVAQKRRVGMGDRTPKAEAVIGESINIGETLKSFNNINIDSLQNLTTRLIGLYKRDNKIEEKDFLKVKSMVDMIYASIDGESGPGKYQMILDKAKGMDLSELVKNLSSVVIRLVSVIKQFYLDIKSNNYKIAEKKLFDDINPLSKTVMMYLDIIKDMNDNETTNEIIEEKKKKRDACYHKVKSRYDVWPSAYGSLALSKCRNVGASNWGNKTKESMEEMSICNGCAVAMLEDIKAGKLGVLTEAKYQGRTVKLGKPMQGDVKKFKVYVKNAKGNVVKVNFGDPNMRIRKSNPARRRSFRARHHCDTNPGPRWKARYWSCRKW